MSKNTVAAFLKDPASFLKSNGLQIGGGANRGAGPAIFTMSYHAGDDIAYTGFKKSRPCWRASISNTNGGHPGPGVVLGQGDFIAYYIPMKQQADAIANVFGMPPMDGSIDILLTSQLSGCTFGFAAMGGAFVASHLQPVGGVLPAQNRQEMADRIQSAMSGGARLVEKGVDYLDFATVVGKFKGGRWHVYMQRIDNNAAIMQRQIHGVTTLS